jgi:putative DNA primase/helicase
MSSNLFEQIREALQDRLDAVIPELMPGGRQRGREYVCASLQGGSGDSCSTNLDTGKGSDFATGEAWGDIVALAAKIWNCGQGEAARELAERYGITLAASMPSKPQQPTPATFTPITPVPANAPEPPCNHSQYGRISALCRSGTWAMPA